VHFFFPASAFLVLDELDDGHLRVVTAASAEVPNHATVTSFTVRITLRALLKDGIHEILVVNEGVHLHLGVGRTPFGESDHLINVRADSLGTNLKKKNVEYVT